jgi:hypothetical protein
MYGSNYESIRTAGTMLVREAGVKLAYVPMAGTTLRQLAKFVDADIDSPFSCGNETPDVGDPDELLDLSAEHVDTIARWYEFGWVVLDKLLGELPDSAEPAILQLWPEHFDIGTNIALPQGDRVNLGCSLGDRYIAEPYLYLGPWSDARPGDPSYWNAPFGAALRASEIPATANPAERALDFMRDGLGILGGAAR